VAAVVASGLLPGAIEIMDNLTIQAVEQSLDAGYPTDAAALLIVELEGEANQVQADFIALEKIIGTSAAYSVRSAQDEAERALIWKGRKGAFAALGSISQAYIVQDGVVPRSQLGAALAEIDEMSARYRLRVANVFHAGDGNLHPNVLFDGSQEGMLERAEALAGEITQMCVRRGGVITGEHGVGMEKREYMPDMFAEADMEMMRRLSREIDPRGIANAGKMFPGERVPGV
jgi:glycolate oxidase